MRLSFGLIWFYSVYTGYGVWYIGRWSGLYNNDHYYCIYLSRHLVSLSVWLLTE